MCMKTVDFSFEPNKSYGVGYKSYPVDDNGRIIGTTSNYNSQDKPIARKKWLTAQRSRPGIQSGQHTVTDDPFSSRKEYQSGFHIFLDKEAAEKYGGEYSEIVEVHYKDVVAFGTNRAHREFYPCIIARNMKVVRTVRKAKRD
jgi:hypothetical protein